MSDLVNLSLHLVISWLIINAAEARKPTVETTYGKVSGISKSDANGKSITMFLGIPYAKAPIGPLRFMKPEKADPWDGVFEATKFGHACIQMPAESSADRVMNSTLNFTKSEDCLFINIFVPGNFKRRLNNPKAVMVYMHGGALLRGSTNIFRGDEFALSQDIIFVSMNYRLGLFGFMASDDNTIPGNQGFFDQLLALKWVKENIAAFGGDLSKITIFGQSAGGSSVVFHVISPLSVGLFSRAIAQSSALATMRTRQGQYEVIRKAVTIKCGKIKNAQKLLECVQGLSTEEIVELHRRAFKLGYIMACTDGEFLPDDYQVLLSAGKFNRNVKMIIGYLRDDGDLTIPYSDWKTFVREGVDIPTAKDMIKDSYTFLAQEKSNEDIVNDLVFKKYINCKTDPLEIARGVLTMRTDVWFGVQPFMVADQLAKFGVDVYIYRFDHLTNYLRENWQPTYEIYAGHIHDVMYIIGTGFNPDLNELFTDKEKLLSASFRTGFSSFAKQSKVVYLTKDLVPVPWRPYTNEKKRFLVLTTDMSQKSMQPVSEDELKRAALWTTVVPAIWDIHGCQKKRKRQRKHEV